jgi:hypothetical protein
VKSNVTVLVANGTSVGGAASAYSQQLSGQGWSVLSPADTTVPVSTSTVYYASGQQAAAAAIATALGLKATSVAPLSNAVPVSSRSGADVVLVLGTDLAQHAPSSG